MVRLSSRGGPKLDPLHIADLPKVDGYGHAAVSEEMKMSHDQMDCVVEGLFG